MERGGEENKKINNCIDSVCVCACKRVLKKEKERHRGGEKVCERKERIKEAENGKLMQLDRLLV